MVRLVAHRGDGFFAPENTLEAFVRTWQHGVNWVEGDFHLTKDGQMVCHHDASTARTAGVDKRICDQTFDELQKLDVGRTFSPDCHCQIPTLSEILHQMPETGGIYVELKAGDLLLDAIEELLATGKWRPDQISFLANSPKVKERFPEHEVFWCIGNYRTPGAGNQRWTPEELVREAQERKADGVSIWYGSGITDDYITALHDSHLSVHAWTVDLLWDAQQLAAAGVDSITSNRATMLRQWGMR